MRGKWMILVLVALLCAPGWAGAVSEDDFELDTTADLVELCTVPSSDPRPEGSVRGKPSVSASASWWGPITIMWRKIRVRQELLWFACPIHRRSDPKESPKSAYQQGWGRCSSTG